MHSLSKQSTFFGPPLSSFSQMRRPSSCCSLRLLKVDIINDFPNPESRTDAGASTGHVGAGQQHMRQHLV